MTGNDQENGTTMAGMPQPKHATGRLLLRAQIAAWVVFVSMAGTTMAFQVYHSLKHGHMPWELAYLYGTVPLLISMCILEIVTEWREAPGWAKAAAYLVMGGAMFLSASATGAVVFRAAPARLSGLFGLLMDGAALLAVHFLLNGPRKAAEKAAREASEATAREDAKERELAALRAELGTVREALDAAESGRTDAEARAERQAELETLLEAAQEARESAESEAETVRSAVVDAERKTADAEEAAERLRRRLAAQKPNGRRAKVPNTARRTAPNASDQTQVPDDFDARTEALGVYLANPEISGKDLGAAVGLGERWGQKRKAEFAASAQGQNPEGS